MRLWVMAELKLVDADIEKYKYNGIHFHLHGLYILTKEDLMALLEKHNTRTPKERGGEK